MIFDGFWWFLSSIEYRSNMIFDVFHNKSKLLSFSQKSVSFTIRQISKTIRKLTFSVLRDLLLAARRLRWTKATNSTEIIRICVSDCQCEKLPFADFGIHNSKNVAVARVRLWKLFLSCCVVHGTEQCNVITQNHNRVWSHSQSVTNPSECAVLWLWWKLHGNSSQFWLHVYFVTGCRISSYSIFWVTANRVASDRLTVCLLHHCRRGIAHPIRRRRRRRPRPASPKARSCKYKNKKCRLWSTFEFIFVRFVTGKTERKIITFPRKIMKKH